MVTKGTIEMPVKDYTSCIMAFQKLEVVRRIAIVGASGNEGMKTKLECIRMVIGDMKLCLVADESKQEDQETMIMTGMDGTERSVSASAMKT